MVERGYNMIEISISSTFADRDKLIYYEELTGFTNTISKLEEVREEKEFGGIVTTGLDEIIWLFKQFEVKECSNHNFGNSVFISDKNEFISNISSNVYFKKSNNIYDSWLMMLRNLNETIDELFRYGAKDTNDDVIFLKNILVFLSYVSIYEDENTWKDLIS